jgi:ankyrin repeat protein
VSPLLLAVGRGGRGSGGRGGNPEALRVLVGFGADVDAAAEGSGDTALHVSAAAGATEMVRTLLALGSRPDVTNRKGETPLSLAERLSDKSAADLLRQAGR